MNKNSSFLKKTVLIVIAFLVVTFFGFRVSGNDATSTTNVYFFPDGQRHSTVDVDVIIVASTQDGLGFENLYYEWWYSNPLGDDFPVTDAGDEPIIVQVKGAEGKKVVKFNASNFSDCGLQPVDTAGKYYVKVTAVTKIGEYVSYSQSYNLKKDSAGSVKINEITNDNPQGNVSSVWVEINFSGLYAGSDSTITSRVYKIGEEGEWQEYKGPFKLFENTKVFAEYSDGTTTLADSLEITSIDAEAPTLEIFHAAEDPKNALIRVFEEISGLATVKYAWVKYNKNNDTFTKDTSAVVLWKTITPENYPTGISNFNISLNPNTDIPSDGYYFLHAYAKDRVGNTSEECVGSEHVVVDRTGPHISFDDKGVSQSQNFYEIIINVDEDDLGINLLSGYPELYFFMLIGNESPFITTEGLGADDFKEELLENVFEAMHLGSWIYRDVEGKIVVRMTPEYFGKRIEDFDEKITLYVKAVDEHGNKTLASTENTYHVTGNLPQRGKLFVNAHSDVWTEKIKHAQIVLIPEFSEEAITLFQKSGVPYNTENLEVYYTIKYDLSPEDVADFNALFETTGNVTRLVDFNDISRWKMQGSWEDSRVYEGGYLGAIEGPSGVKPREMLIDKNTGLKAIRVMLLDPSTGLVEIYTQYEYEGQDLYLIFNNIDSNAPTILVSSNWGESVVVGKHVVVNLEITDDFGFLRTANVQYQWTNFTIKSELDYSKWLSFTPNRIPIAQPLQLFTQADSIVKSIGDGNNYLWIRVVDSVGNEELKLTQFIIDTNPPEVELKVRNPNSSAIGDYLSEDDYILLLEPQINNAHVRLELTVSDDESIGFVGNKITQVQYRWVPDRGDDSGISWNDVSGPNLQVLNAGDAIIEEINHVENVGTGFFKLQVRAKDIAGNFSDIVSSPVYYIINRTPNEPSLRPILVYDDSSDQGLIEIAITTTDSTVSLFKYSTLKNGEFTSLYNFIAKPTYEYAEENQYIKAKSMNIIGSLSASHSELSILPKWFTVPKVFITNMGSNTPTNLRFLESELINVLYNRYGTDITTSYTGTEFAFDKLEFALTNNNVDLSNIESSNVTWLQNLDQEDIEAVVENSGIYRFWVRVYNEYDVTPTDGTKAALAYGYGFVEYNLSLEAPEIVVKNQELFFEETSVNLLSEQFVEFSEDITNLTITISVNGVVINNSTILQDAGDYYIMYDVIDQAGNRSISDVLNIRIKGLVLLHGDQTTQELYGYFEESIGLSKYKPEAPERYVFEGWYPNEDFNPNQKVTSALVSKKPLNLYANFVDGPRIVTLDPNGGVVSQTKLLVPIGEAIDYFPTPSLSGYQFAGWYDSEDNLLKETTLITKDITYTARWEGKDLTIMLNKDLGTEEDIPYLHKDDQKFGEELGELPVPVKSGYIFVGWFLNNVEYTSTTRVYTDLILKAKWAGIQYAVVLHPNNGDADITITGVYGSTLSGVPTLYKEGHEFVSWYKDAGFTQPFDIEATIITGGLELFARWEKEKYIVTFVNDVQDAPIEQIVYYGDTAVAPTPPTKNNYLFVGWVKHQSDEALFDFTTEILEDLILFPRWEAENYTITFKLLNGEDDVTLSAKYNAIVYNPNINPEWEGHTFLGWTDNIETGTSISFPLFMAEDLTLYAKWDTNKLFAVVLYNNTNQVDNYYEYNYGDEIEGLTYSPKTGYEFVEWQINDEAFSFPYTMTKNVVIEAKWQAEKRFVTFVDNYDTSYVVETYYNSIIMPIPTLERLEYRFVAWYKNSQLTERYLFFEPVKNDFTLYAKWEPKYFRIFFDSNGGTNINYYQVKYQASLNSYNPIPEKEGFDFVAWYLDEALTNEFSFTGAQMPANDIYLYAKWIEATYELTFDYGQGYPGGRYKTTIMQHHDIISRPDDPEMSGMYFSGWYLDDEFSQMFIFDSPMPNHNLRLYAKWLEKYKVEYFDGANLIGRDDVAEGMAADEPNEPDKVGYKFEGWYTESALINKYDFSQIVENDIKLYAGWTSHNVTVFFDTRGAENIDSMTGPYGGNLVLPIPEKENYTFIVWEDKYGVPFISTTFPNEHINLYAVWAAKPYSITFDTGEGSPIETLIVQYGEALNLPESQRDGYYFDAWLLDGELFEDTTMPGKNIVLVARWNREYTPGLIFELDKATQEFYAVIGYTGSSTSVYIPDYYKGLPVKEIRRAALSGKEFLESVTIASNVERIQNTAFHNNPNLKSIYFEEGSKLKTIDTNAFSRNSKLEIIELPSGLEEIGTYAFSEAGLKSIIIPATVTSIGSGAFSKNYNLETAEFEAGTSIEAISAILFSYTNLSSFVVPATVTNISNGAFSDIPSLRSLTILNSETNIEHSLLINSSNVEVLTIPGSKAIAYYYGNKTEDVSPFLHTVNVVEGSTSLVNNFASNLGQIKTVVLPNTIKGLGFNVFLNATNLININIPNTVETIGVSAFEGTLSLQEITFPNNPKFTTISGSILKRSSIKEIFIPKYVEKISSSAFEDTQINSIVFEEASNLIIIDSQAFLRTKITSVVVPNGVTTIGREAFGEIETLRTVSFPSSITDSSTSLVGSLHLSNNVESLTIPGHTRVVLLFNSSSYSPSNSKIPIVLSELSVSEGSLTIANSFISGVNQIKTVNLPDSLITIGVYAFASTGGLTSINLPDSVKTISQRAFSDSSISIINISENSNLETIEIEAFLNSKIKNIYIPTNVSSLGAGVFKDAKLLESVTFAPNNAIEELKGDLFRNTPLLTSLNNIPTSLTRIGAYTFYESGLSKLILPEGIITIGRYAFSKMTNLTEISLPLSFNELKSSYVLQGSTNLVKISLNGSISIGKLYGSSNVTAPNSVSKFLTTVNILPGSTEITTSFAYNIPSITEVSIPEGIITINIDAFRGATGIYQIILPESLKTISQRAFENTSLTSIIIPKNVESMGQYAFSNNLSLTSVTFAPNINLETIPGYAFNLTGITSFVVPNSVTTINHSALANNYNLKTVYIGANVTSYSNILNKSNVEEITLPSTTSLARVFSGTDTSTNVSNKLTKVTVLLGSTQLPDKFAENLSQLSEVILPEGLLSIGNSAFYNTKIVSISIPDSVTTIGNMAFAGASKNPSGLSYINISENSNLQHIGERAFEYSKIITIYLPKDFTTLGVAAFRYAASLENVIFAENIKITVIPNAAFHYAAKIREIELPNTITQIGADAFNYTNIEHITLSEAVTSIGNSAFANNYSLQEMTILNNSVTFGTTILSNSTKIEQLTYSGSVPLSTLISSGASSLNKITILDGVTSLPASFANGATNLRTIVLPNTLEEIGTLAFWKMKQLSNINIPDSLHTIGSRAFEGTTALKNITFGANTSLTNIGESAFKDSGIITFTIPSTVKTLGYEVFSGATKLINVQFAEGTQITEIPSKAFANTAITSLVIPSTITSIGKDAFINIPLLKTINIPFNAEVNDSIFSSSNAISELTVSGHKRLSSYFSGNDNIPTSLKRVIVLGESEYIVDDFAKNGSAIEEVILPNSITSIGDRAFQLTTKLKTINIPNNIISIGEDAFRQTGLSNFTISENSKLKTIGASAFYNSSIKSIYLPKTLESMGNSVFYQASKLTSVIFDPEISITKIPEKAFAYTNNSAFYNIVIPESVTTIEASAFQYSYLRVLTIPEAVTELIGTSQFANMAYLTEFHILNPELVLDSTMVSTNRGLSVLTIGGKNVVKDIFSGYTSNLKVIVTPGSTEIADDFVNAFAYVKEVIIPESVTKIGDRAFYKNNGIAELIIPSTVTSIGEQAIYDMNAIRNLVLLNLNVGETLVYGEKASIGLIHNNRLIKLTISGNYKIEDIIGAKFINNNVIEVTVLEGTTEIVESFAEGNTRVQKVILPEGLTTINSKAFKGLNNLTINRPTTLVNIAPDAFDSNPFS